MDIYSTIAEEIAKFKKDVPNSNALFYVDMSPEMGDEDDDYYVFIRTLPNGKISVRTYTFNADNLPVASAQDTLEAKYRSRYLKDTYSK